MRELLLSPGGLLFVYLLLINAVTFLVYGVDKWSARRDGRRVPERTLFVLPLVGGTVGAFLGMRVFRHKTRHWYFVFGIPAIFAAQVALAVFLCTRA